MKSHVTMLQRCCVVTGKLYDTGEIAIDRKLREKFEDKTNVGWGISPDVQEKLDEGFVVFIGIDPEKTPPGATVKPETAYRTGHIMYLKREKAEEIFSGYVGAVQFANQDVLDMFEVDETDV